MSKSKGKCDGVVYVVGSSSWLEENVGGVGLLKDVRREGGEIACVSGAGRWLMDRDVNFDMYGCLEMGNVEIYSGDMAEMVKRFGYWWGDMPGGIPVIKFGERGHDVWGFLFYFSVYAHEWAKKTNLVRPRWMDVDRWREGEGKPWEVVPEGARIVVSEDVMYPRYVQVPYLRGTVTGGVLMALRLAWEKRFKVIHLYACEGYPLDVDRQVYADGIVGNSDKTGVKWRMDTNESAAGAIAWMTNEYKDVTFYFHGRPAYSREQMKDWRVTFVDAG